jgi:hypothetical protein
VCVCVCVGVCVCGGGAGVGSHFRYVRRMSKIGSVFSFEVFVQVDVLIFFLVNVKYRS